MVQSQQSLPPLKNKPFSASLKALAQEVETVLDDILPPPSTHLHKAMRYSVLGGGKRLRSYLMWASAHLFEVLPQDVIKGAAALELIQAYSLVHDDLPCMDNADTRRGKPSCHKAFGEAPAILVGDALIPLSFHTLASLEASPQVRLELIKGLGHTIGSLGLVAGQMMDLGYEGPRSTLENLLEQQRLKTGVLFGFSTEAGAILGQASREEQKALRSYGLLFGKGFQMIDDWLDGCGSEAVMGKPCGQDVEKFTFLSFLSPSLLAEQARLVMEEALEELSPFGEKAQPLRNAVQYVLSQIE